MANPTVDKVKDVAIRHGEKAVVAVSAGLFLAFVYTAISKEPFDITPEQVSQAAQGAQRNLSRAVPREELVKKFENEFLKPPDLVKQVAAVAEHKPISVANLQPFVTLDPTTGVVRDMPTVIAPTDLAAQPGRGGTLVYKRDESGDLVYASATPEPAAPAPRKPPTSAPRRGRGRPSSSSSSSGSPEFNPGVAFPTGAPAAESDDRAARRERERTAQAIAGAEAKPAAEETTKPESTEETRKPLEIIKGYRWVAITGLFDNQKQREILAHALKVPITAAYPQFEELEVERKRLNPDGTWTDWAPLDRDKDLDILENVPELDKELTEDQARLDPLVDDLPFLKTGYYRGVHHAALLTEQGKAALRAPATPAAAAGNPMMPGSPPGMMMPGSPPGETMMSNGMMPDGSRSEAALPPPGSAASAEDKVFAKSDLEKIMIRVLDYQVEPEASYRYRARVVIRNPNYQRSDVSFGVDTKSKDLSGPWSEPTNVVTMPPDVSAYALAKSTMGLVGRGDEVQFQVAVWKEDDGQTVVSKFDAGPGQVVGTDQSKIKVPDPEGRGVKIKPVDFISRQVVLDTEGGARTVNQSLGLNGPDLPIPAVAVLLRPDGSVVVHSESKDTRNQEMKNTESDYKTAVTEGEDNKKREGSKKATHKRKKRRRGS